MAYFYVKNESRMFSAFIWYTYCPFRSKIMNFQKIVVPNVSSQSRLLRRHLTTKLCNLGLCSKALEEDKDVSFHLRSCLGGLWWKTRAKWLKKPCGHFPPPPVYRQTKKPGLIRVKKCNINPWSQMTVFRLLPVNLEPWDI